MENLTPKDWLQLKKPTREALVKIFNIPQSSFTHVVNNVVDSDGHTFNDLQAISIESMKELTHSPSDSFDEQFNLIIKMVEDEGGAVVSPENATTNVNTTVPVGSETTIISDPIGGVVGSYESTPAVLGAEEGVKPEAPVSEEQVLPVSGGVDTVDRGSAELLPDTGHDDKAVVAAEDAKVDIEKPKAGKSAKR